MPSKLPVQIPVHSLQHTLAEEPLSPCPTSDCYNSSVIMSILPGYSPQCPHHAHFYDCNTYIGCSSTDLCNGDYDCSTDCLKPANFNTTYSVEGVYHAGGNETLRENTTPPSPSCHGCPHRDLHSSLVSRIMSDIQSTGAQSTSYTIIISMPSPLSANTADVQGEEVQGTSSAQGPASMTSVPSAVTAAAKTTQSAIQTATESQKSNTAAIEGGVAGGIIGLALLIGLLAICCHRRMKPRQLMDKGRSPPWSLGLARSLQPVNADLEEMKQGSSQSVLCHLSI